MGCNIVITRNGDAQEYFEDYAYYCNPKSPDSIFKAIEKASSNSIQPGLSELVREKYTWEVAARKTLDAYVEILEIQ